MTAKEKEDPGSKRQDSEDEEVFFDARYPPEEEADLLAESKERKAEANKLFASSHYSEAITTYDRALASCPNYLDFEIGVLKSNIAACHLKLEDWKAAVDAATASIDCLERMIPSKPKSAETSATTTTKDEDVKREDTASTVPADIQKSERDVVELQGDGEDDEVAELKKLVETDTRKEDVMRIRAKSLMRRGRGRMELGGWANLQGAEEDYKELIQMNVLPPQDQRVVHTKLKELPMRINVAREKEVGEMMGKLKDLGNGILNPFGLSTDNFKFTKDEQTGGYSMSFDKQ